MLIASPSPDVEMGITILWPREKSTGLGPSPAISWLREVEVVLCLKPVFSPIKQMTWLHLSPHTHVLHTHTRMHPPLSIALLCLRH